MEQHKWNFEITFRTDKVRPSKEYNSFRKTKSRTHSRWNSELPKELATTCYKDGTLTNTQDGTGVQTKMQTSCRLTKNKMEKSAAQDRTQVSYICLCSWWWWWWRWWRWLRNGCVSWNEVTPQMCQYINIILDLKLIRNFHYEVLWEVSNRKCPRLYSNMIHTLWWYTDVNLRERVLIIGYVGHACWIYKPNNIRNLEHGLQSKHGP